VSWQGAGGETNESRCEAVRRLLETHARGTPGGSSRDLQVAEHLASCAACRQAAAETDPTAIFFELRSGSLPAEFWAGFSERLRSRLAEKTRAAGAWTSLFRDPLAALRHPGALLRYPRLAYLAPAAMLLILAVTLAVLRPGRLGLRGWSRPETIRSPYAQPVGPHVPGRSSLPPPAGRLDRAVAPQDLPVPPPAGAGVPLMEEVGSPGARVYRFTVGGAEDETPIYFVVDESIDI
jgi:hypothetical protein